jgi:cytochrome c oxidase subunit 2
MGRALAVIIWILTLLSVILFVSKKWWFPEAISAHAPALDRQFMITIVIVGIAFTAAQIGLGWMVWKYRETGDGSRATYTHGSNKLEVLWTVVTAVIFISLAVMGQSVWASLRLHEAPAGSYTVEVVAQQFAWNFHYPGKDGLFGRSDPTLIDEPNNRSGLMILIRTPKMIQYRRPGDSGEPPGGIDSRSKDVIHSFRVPPLRFKRIWCRECPSRFTSRLQSRQVRAGLRELCGQNHFKMKATCWCCRKTNTAP